MSSSISIVSAAILLLIAVYNLAKIPWYLGWLPTPAYGLETSMPFHWAGYRGPKLTSHPTLFLAPHAFMGSMLMTILAAYLVMSDDVRTTLIRIYVVVALVFGIHTIPERQGIPNRTKGGKPLNETAFALLCLGCLFILFDYQLIGLIITMIPLLGAAVLELSKPMKWGLQLLLRRDHDNVPSSFHSPDGDQPLPRNPNGYSACPCAKFFDIDKEVYPVPPETHYMPIE